jgi:hypothetical protein
MPSERAGRILVGERDLPPNGRSGGSADAISGGVTTTLPSLNEGLC